MKKRRIPEVMDDPVVDKLDHARALRSLNRVNSLFGMNRRIRERLQNFGAADFSLLDLGCGGGGFLAYLARRKNHHYTGFLVGLDHAPYALSRARNWHPSGIKWVAADARSLPLADASIDVVMCSLFLHHFDAAEAIVVLREAARVARRGLVVADLARSWLAWGLTWIMTRILSRSWVFHVDGPRSVRAAFLAVELSDLARQAGLHDAKVERRFPFRLLLTWNKLRPTSDRR